jgi:predicted Na+-dependent transporter
MSQSHLLAGFYTIIYFHICGSSTVLYIWTCYLHFQGVCYYCRYYAPALGFLMFAVGVNSSAKDFIEAIKRPDAIAAGYIGHFVIKPLFGFLFGTLAVAVLNLPAALGKKLNSCIFICFRSIAEYVVNSDINLSVGAGIMLVSCVSGAQLSNYATFLIDPHMAFLSIVMTSLSTATAVFVTPTLSYFLIGQKLPGG